jgi:hypothetical protein
MAGRRASSPSTRHQSADWEGVQGEGMGRRGDPAGRPSLASAPILA